MSAEKTVSVLYSFDRCTKFRNNFSSLTLSCSPLSLRRTHTHVTVKLNLLSHMKGEWDILYSRNVFITNDRAWKMESLSLFLSLASTVFSDARTINTHANRIHYVLCAHRHTDAILTCSFFSCTCFDFVEVLLYHLMYCPGPFGCLFIWWI